VVDELVAVDRGVQDRVPVQLGHRGARHEGEIGERHAATRHPLLQLAARGRDPVEVDFDDRRAVRRGAPTLEHVLGDPRSHRRHRLAALPGQDLRGRRCAVALARRRGSLGTVGGLDVEWSLGLGASRSLLRWCLRTRFDQGDEVPLADPPPDARAADLREVDAVLVRHPPHNR
jgi:hypothetical protein